MRFFLLFQVLTISLFAHNAYAAESLLKYIWGPPSHSDVRPYLREAKLPHNSQWADDEWRPQDWIDSRGGSPVKVMNGLYESRVIKDQYFDGDVPVLEVGQEFLLLSTRDQARVLAFVDDVYKVTSTHPAGIISICLDHADQTIGVFTKDGLQVQ